MADDVLVVDGLMKVYSPGSPREVRAVDDVSLRVGANEVVGLLGPNGAGKTTTIKSICGLVTPTAGEISIDGIDGRRNRRSALRNVAAVLEGNRTVYWRLSVRENLEYFASLRGMRRAAIADRAEECIGRFGLEAKATTPAMKLSRGMQQKLALACAVLVEPPLLLLDEPTLGLDVETSIELRTYLRSLAADARRGILLSSHDMAVVRDVCDRVVIINHGRVVVDDRVDNLLAVFRARTYEISLVGPIPPEALARLRGRVEMVDVSEDDSGHPLLTVGLGAPERLYDLMDELRAAGAVVESIDRSEPDLEEVFLSFVRREGTQAGEHS